MAGLVAFNNMPADIRVPLFYAEINAGTPPYSGTSATLLVDAGFIVNAEL